MILVPIIIVAALMFGLLYVAWWADQDGVLITCSDGSHLYSRSRACSLPHGSGLKGGSCGSSGTSCGLATDGRDMIGLS